MKRRFFLQTLREFISILRRSRVVAIAFAFSLLCFHTGCRLGDAFGVKPISNDSHRNTSPATALIIQGSARIIVGACSGAYTVTATDASGNPSELTEEVSLLLSGTGTTTFYSDAGCATPLSSIGIGQGAHSVTFFLKDSAAENLELQLASSVLPGTSFSIVVTTSVLAVLWSGADSIRAGSCAEYHLGTIDGDGNAAERSASMNFALSSGAGGDFYSDDDCLNRITSVSLPQGKETQSVYFKTPSVDTVSLSVSTADLPPASLAVTVEAGAVSMAQSTVNTTGGNVIADQVAAAVVQVTLRDAFGNPISGKALSLSAVVGTGLVVFPPIATTNDSGNATFSVKSATAGSATLEARVLTDGDLALSPRVSLSFVKAFLSLGETSFDFGLVSQGSTVSHVITVRNNGGASATNLAISGLSDAFFPQNGCGASLAAGLTCEITVSFTPPFAGVIPAQTLRLSYSSISAASGTDTTVNDLLSGSGVSNALLTLSESSVDFGSPDVGGSLERELTVTNDGQTAATNLGFTGLSGDYSLDHNCGNSLASGGNCAVKVTVSPSVAGANSQKLQISYNKLGAVSGTNATVTADFTVTAVGGSPLTLYIADGNSRIRKVSRPDTILPLVGTPPGEFSWDGVPTNQSEIYPNGMVTDEAGNTYIADAVNNRVQKVTPSGVVSTVAGSGVKGFSGDGAAAVEAQLSSPSAVVLDSKGNLYIVDSENSRVRRVAQDGVITTFAGTDPETGNPPEGVAATSAVLSSPHSIAVDRHDNLYLTCPGDQSILKITPLPEAMVDRVVTGGMFFGVAVDRLGSIFYSDNVHHRVLKRDPAGETSIIAGTGAMGFSGDGGSATLAHLNNPLSVALDGAGNLYVGDNNNQRVRRVTPGGIINTVVGDGVSGEGGDYGLAIAAQLIWVQGLAVDFLGNLYFSDYGRVRKVVPSITTIAGNGTSGPDPDTGPATSATMSSPMGIALDGAGNLYFADSGKHRVRKVTPQGVISKVAGEGSAGFSGDNALAISAKLSLPADVAVDGKGNLYIADSGNNRVRKVTPAGVISTVAGNGVFGCCDDDGPAISARLAGPMGLALDSAGNLYIADSGNHRIRRVTPQGTISTITGEGTGGYSGDDGPALSARLNFPQGVTVDGSGNLYIADTDNHRIRKVTTDGNISTIAGEGTDGFTGDFGPAVSARLSRPAKVKLDASGNVYIAEPGSHRVRVISANGRITTIAGSGGTAFTGEDGPATLATVRAPAGIAVLGTVGVGP